MKRVEEGAKAKSKAKHASRASGARKSEAKAKKTAKAGPTGKAASRFIDERIRDLSYMKVVKLTFARGASLPDPSRLFNSSLEGNTRRAIDIREGEQVDADAFRALVKAAVARNASAKKR